MNTICKNTAPRTMTANTDDRTMHDGRNMHTLCKMTAPQSMTASDDDRTMHDDRTGKKFISLATSSFVKCRGHRVGRPLNECQGLLLCFFGCFPIFCGHMFIIFVFNINLIET